MDVVDEITDAINILNKVDDYGESLTSRLSELDSKEQDILHYIESNKINILWCYNIIKKIKEIRIARRKVKNDMDILSKYESNKTKLLTNNNRQFLVTELHKKEKSLDTEYKNRVYSEEDMNNILKGVSTDVKQ